MSFLVNGRPTLTAMVQARTPERTIELIKKGLEGGADAFGVQLETLERKYHIMQELERIFNAADGKPIYITNYRSGENEDLSDEELTNELLEIASFPNVLIDIMGDAFAPSEYQIAYNDAAVLKQKQLIAKLHEKGAEVLMSSHTNCYLPQSEVLKIADAQQSRGVDIAKIVTQANNEAEQLDNFAISAAVAQKMKIPTLFLCAGECVYRHRRAAPFIGNNSMFLCVVEQDPLSTPLQPLLSDAKKLIDIIDFKA